MDKIGVEEEYFDQIRKRSKIIRQNLNEEKHMGGIHDGLGFAAPHN